MNTKDVTSPWRKVGSELEGVITEFGVAHSPADIYNLGEIKSG